MYQAIEAICRAGQIIPLEPVRVEENEHLVIVRMPAAPAAATRPTTTEATANDWQHFAGMLKDSPNWNGDPQTVQEAMRREWD
ncbi:MAG: hypothetical protein RLZZ373_1227 [Pseudomonadota bacterium]